jgi:hypothetical protein
MTACAIIAKMAPDAVNGGNDMCVVMVRWCKLKLVFASTE